MSTLFRSAARSRGAGWPSFIGAEAIVQAKKKQLKGNAEGVVAPSMYCLYSSYLVPVRGGGVGLLVPPAPSSHPPGQVHQPLQHSSPSDRQAGNNCRVETPVGAAVPAGVHGRRCTQDSAQVVFTTSTGITGSHFWFVQVHQRRGLS